MNPALSPELKPNEPGLRSRAQLATKIAVGAPLLTLFLGLCFSFAEDEPSGTGFSSVALAQAGLSGLLLLIGLTATFYVLWSIRRHGRKGLLWPGLAGLALNSALLSLLVIVTIFALQKRREQQLQAIRQFKRSSDETMADLRKKPPFGTSQAVDEFAQRNVAINNRAAQDSTGAAKLVFAASAAYLERLQQEGRPYMQAVDSLQVAQVLLPDSNLNREKIAQNRELTLTFVKTTLSFSNFVHNSGSIYRSELKARSLSPEDFEIAAHAFDEKESNRLIQAQIFGTNVRIGNAYLAILELLDQHFGQWKKDPKTGLVLFSDPIITERYKASLAEIDAASELRADLQRKTTK